MNLEAEPQATLRRWIEEELIASRAEGESDASFLEPKTQACVFLNVLATHVREFLQDKALVQALRDIFEQRGVTGELWFLTLCQLGVQMNQEQLPILGWLMEERSTKVGIAQVLRLKKGTGDQN